jgi:Tfp pilus assembly protein PilF
MKKILVLCIGTILFVYSTGAQTSFDKNKISDFFQNQQYEDAINYLTPILDTDPKNISLLGYMGYANYMNDNENAAEKYYRQIYDIDSANIAAISYLGILTKIENPGESLSFYRRLVNLQPTKASHYRNMAELLKRKQPDTALFFYNKAYQLLPTDQKNSQGLAEALIDNKTFLRADSIIEVALKNDSLNISFLKLAIRSAYNSGNYQNTIVPGERLVRLNDPALTALTQVALSYYTLKLYNDCIRICNYMDQLGIANERILYYEAKAWSQLKEFSKSNTLLKTCITMAISKDAETYYYNLAQNYESLKQYKDAISNYDTAYYIFKNPVMKYNCGRIYELSLKDSLLARKYYTEYLAKANPSDAEEKKAYEYVKSKWSKAASAKK